MARIKKTYSRPKNTPPTKRRRDQAIKAKNKPKRPKRQRPLPTPYIPDDFKRVPEMTPYGTRVKKGLKGLLGGFAGSRVAKAAKKAAKKVAKKVKR